jgi:hypothetical protein
MGLEEMEHRLEICKQCEKFKFKEDKITLCEETNLDINYTISQEDFVCPLGKFE